MKIFLKLTRVNMSTAIAFSALAGYIIASHTLDWTAISVFLGVLLLAGSATVLNQYQERYFDALMSRTRNRPLPSHQMNPKMALVLAIVLGLKGLAILYFLTTPTTALLGLFNIIWYNGVYTPLKRRTPYVILVGAVTGAIPPLMGWTATGAGIFSPDILFIAAFMFFWQIPHFCLLLLKFRKDYEMAGFPSITSLLSEKRIQFIIFIWIVSTSLSTLIFPLFHLISGSILIVCIILLNVILVSSFYRNAFSKNIAFDLGKSFRSLYLYQVSILAILMIHALI
ncbi:MAG TPA: protoheme IX farnesyltransferase [Bacteroidales bacterium]